MSLKIVTKPSIFIFRKNLNHIHIPNRTTNSTVTIFVTFVEYWDGVEYVLQIQIICNSSATIQ